MTTGTLVVYTAGETFHLLVDATAEGKYLKVCPWMAFRGHRGRRLAATVNSRELFFLIDGCWRRWWTLRPKHRYEQQCREIMVKLDEEMLMATIAGDKVRIAILSFGLNALTDFFPRHLS